MLRHFSFIILLTFCLPLVAEEREYTFAVEPEYFTKPLRAQWQPIVDYLQNQTGYKLKFKTALDMPTFEKRLAAAKYDFIYTGPYHYSVFREIPGYLAIVKRLQQPTVSIIVSHKDADITDITFMDNSIFALTAHTSFASSLMPHHAVFGFENDLKHRVVSSYDWLYTGVAKGMYPIAGGSKSTFDYLDKNIKQQLKIVWQSDAFPSPVIAAHPDIPKQVIAKMCMALLNLKDHPQGAKLLHGIRVKHGFELATDSEWDVINELEFYFLDHLTNELLNPD